MSPRRLVAAAALAGGLALGVAHPAHAGTPDITVTSPSATGPTSTAAPTVTGSASATSPQGTVTGDLQITITSTAGHPGWSTTLSDWCGQPSCRFSVPVSPALAWNGPYTLSVQASEADAGGQSEPVTSVTSFSLAAPAAAPGALTATASAGGSGLNLSWTEPSYPDLVGYRVARTPSGAGFPASVTATSFTDRSATPGVNYTYEVTAVRQGATSGSTVASPPASTSAGLPPPAGDSGPGAPAAGGAGSGVGSFGSAGPGAESAGGGLGDLLQPSAEAGAALPALPAPQAPALPADGVAPGSDNPAVAPFSSGGQAVASGPSPRSVTVTYARTTTTDRAALVRDYAAVALAALLLAVVAHLLWIRRQVELAP